MEMQDAVRAAKNFAQRILADEELSDLGLEEIEFVPGEDALDVTVGFSRPWNSSRGALSAITGENLQKRSYRIIRIKNADGEPVFIKRREQVD